MDTEPIIASSPDEKPAIPVDNVVLWINHEINLPFRLKEHKQADLGMFLVEEGFAGGQIKARLQVAEMHHRSGTLGEVLISDNQNIIYHFVDLKGMGLGDTIVGSEGLFVCPISKRTLGEGDDTWGTWRLDKAERERDITEDMVHNGVRTNRTASIIKLKEIALPDGSKLSIEDAKLQGMIDKDETPVIGVRVYRVRERIHHDNKSRDYLDKAKKIVEEELKRTLTWDEYLEWFATTLGANFAGVHKLGYWHGFPSTHNVTLACEIVDFGFGKGSKKLADLDKKDAEKLVKVDKGDAKAVALSSLRYCLEKFNLVTVQQKRLNDLFDSAYQATLVK